MTNDAMIVQLSVGMPQVYGDPASDEPMERSWETGFYKQPVEGDRFLSKLGLEGDGVADPVHHGGLDKAVLCYAAEHYPVWRNEIKLLTDLQLSFAVDDFDWGGFGENLTISHLTEQTVCLGDIYQLGTALVQVSQPRQPCWKLGRRWGWKQLTALAVATGRMGWYLRVLEEGAVAQGLEVKLVERTLEDWPISRLNELYYHDRNNLKDSQAMADCPLLAEVWRQDFRRRLEKQGS
ncbi:MOSC domain-containing protein [bacterium]|nr:MOSC domain-containing protein [bacterium]